MNYLKALKKNGGSETYLPAVYQILIYQHPTIEIQET